MKNTLILIGGILSASVSPSILNSENLHKTVRALEFNEVKRTVSTDVQQNGVEFRLTGVPDGCKQNKPADFRKLCN